ncbi:MAG: hypothetical protein JSV43_02495 [Methanobacteriota archaeon]|nr:MAG: hypothetical protein JSV43_02495 [Euryarchaeota archaeon]
MRRSDTEKINWRREIPLFFLISFMITSVLFLFFYGLFVYVEHSLSFGFTASQILSVKWVFSLYFAILFSIEAWALGVYEMIERYLERKNILRALGLDKRKE